MIPLQHRFIEYDQFAQNHPSLHDCVRYYRKVGELLDILTPFDPVGVVKKRTGGGKDGGYVMLPPIQGDIIYSFGVSEYSPWDLEMAEAGFKVYQFDGTINAAPDRHPNLFFFKNNIASPSTATPETKYIGQIFQELGHTEADNIVLQCDIEGYEWQMFAEMSTEEMLKFKQIVVEFHDLVPSHPHFDTLLAILRKINQTHTPIHVHCNNNGFHNVMRQKANLPFYSELFEVSYVRTQDYTFVQNQETFPTELDMPNIEYLPDVKIGKWEKK